MRGDRGDTRLGRCCRNDGDDDVGAVVVVVAIGHQKDDVKYPAAATAA